MIWYFVLASISLSAVLIFLKYNNVTFFQKFVLSVLFFLSTFVVIFSLSLTLSNFTFRNYLWLKWACFDHTATYDNFRTVRHVDMIGYKHEEYTIHCRAPLEYTVKINKFGTRSNPPEPNDWSKIDVLLMGDSYIWGTGLNEEETISYNLQKLRKNKTVLNLGVPGGGPTTALRFIELVDSGRIPARNIKNVVYTFRDGVYVRNTGKGRWLFHPRNPQYEIINNSLVYKGIFSSVNDIDYTSNNPFEIIKKFAAGVFHINTTKEVPDSNDIKFTANVINYLYDLSSTKIKAKFYLNLWPEYSNDGSLESRRNEFIGMLNKNIKIINMDEKLTMMVKGRHPTKESAQKVALFIHNKLKEGKK